ncbi:MAG: hypothetical protein K9M10_01010 [Candidatus Pacebacteria bacterium]|nr:hypothetical protein [Candidatus Paceibacterota bacterium]MCF7857042.1 hypothetical protein [Candidatus Paceibacterota bacterium]
MSHPFEKMFENALKKSNSNRNVVFEEATRLVNMGYSLDEVSSVLSKLAKGLISDSDSSIVHEANELLNEDI